MSVKRKLTDLDDLTNANTVDNANGEAQTRADDEQVYCGEKRMRFGLLQNGNCVQVQVTPEPGEEEANADEEEGDDEDIFVTEQDEDYEEVDDDDDVDENEEEEEGEEDEADGVDGEDDDGSSRCERTSNQTETKQQYSCINNSNNNNSRENIKYCDLCRVNQLNEDDLCSMESINLAEDNLYSVIIKLVDHLVNETDQQISNNSSSLTSTLEAANVSDSMRTNGSISLCRKCSSDPCSNSSDAFRASDNGENLSTRVNTTAVGNGKTDLCLTIESIEARITLTNDVRANQAVPLSLDEDSRTSSLVSSSSEISQDTPTCSSTSSGSASCSSSSSSIGGGCSSTHVTRALQGLLKPPNSMKHSKRVNFTDVTVYYFPRSQGFTCVPSTGGSTLGMDYRHCYINKFSLEDHAHEKRRNHRNMLLRRKKLEKLCNSRSASESEEDSLDDLSDISDSELDDDSYFLQPVSLRQRRALLRASGIRKIEALEREECEDIRISREYCGCKCRVYCDPETCQCSLAGIKCQVDRFSFPCGCTRDDCGNLYGRVEFNPLRVRTHFIHTLMRLELEKKNEQQMQEDQAQHSSGGESSSDSSNDLNPITANSHCLLENGDASNAFLSNAINSVGMLLPRTPIVYSDANSLACSSLANMNHVQSISGANDFSTPFSPNVGSYSDNSDCSSDEYDDSDGNSILDIDTQDQQPKLNHLIDNHTINSSSTDQLPPFPSINMPNNLVVSGGLSCPDFVNMFENHHHHHHHHHHQHQHHPHHQHQLNHQPQQSHFLQSNNQQMTNNGSAGTLTANMMNTTHITGLNQHQTPTQAATMSYATQSHLSNQYSYQELYNNQYISNTQLIESNRAVVTATSTPASGTSAANRTDDRQQRLTRTTHHNNDENENHYTDLSQSFVSKSVTSMNGLISAGNVKHFHLTTTPMTPIDDDSSSRLIEPSSSTSESDSADSTQTGELLAADDNVSVRLSEQSSQASQSSQEDLSENFGEIIKKTMVETVTA